MATPGGPRPGSLPPNFNPNALANNMQHLQINQADRQQSGDFGGGGAPRPNGAPFAQHSPPITGVRPGQSPPGVFPRVPPPPGAPGQAAFPPNVMSAVRPTGPLPRSQPPQPFNSGSPQPGARPGQGPLSASPLPTGPPAPTHMSTSSAVSNGPPGPASGSIQNRPQFTPFTGSDSMLRPSVGPPHAPTLMSSGLSQLPEMHRNFNGQSLGTPPSMGQPAPPLSAPPQNNPPPPGPMQLPTPGSGIFRPPGSPGMSMWPPQQQQVVPSLPSAGPVQNQPMFGMPPPPPLPSVGPMQHPMFGMPPAPPLPNQLMSLNQTGKSTIDMENIPRPSPSSAVILHETRRANQANPPPPATSDYIVTDTGNCSPRYIRCTINQIPCTVDLLSTSAMQLALLIQPLALQHPSEEPIQVVDFGESGPVRCSRCKGYINPFMKFIDQGRRFICNLCGFTNETPQDYCCNLGPDGQRRDAVERPELCRGTVEFVATKEFMLRDPMPPVYFFLIDVSMNAIQTGATATTCSSINQIIADLPEDPRTMVGIATFDSTIHFYNIRRADQQVSMLIVPDIQDVYTPLKSDVIVQLAECRQQLEILLESIPNMFQSSRIADSAFGAAAKAAFLALKSTGGKLLVFQSVLPSIGLGSLSARKAEGRSDVPAGEKEGHKLLQPVDNTLNDMAIEFAGHQVCVDLFITTQTYVDIASLSVIPRITGGQVYYYYPFSLCDSAKLYNDLRWNVTRPQGFEAVMRVRCSKGIEVQDYFGNFCKNIPTDVDIPAIDCDKTIMVSLKHDDKLPEGTECAFQCALLYTTVSGQRRIRVSTLSLPCTNVMANLFPSADLDTQFACILKRAANEIPKVPLAKVRDQATSVCTNILYAYRKFCATVSSPGQFILPEALKLLPIYVLALLKSRGLQSDGKIDERSSWINYVSHLPTPLVIPLVHPRMIAIHDLDEKESDYSIVPTPIPLSSEHITDEGLYLLENGEDCLIYIGSSVQPNILRQLFNISSVQEISSQFILEQYDNPLSKKLDAILNEIRRQRCSYLRIKFCRKGDPSGTLFFSYMVEDKMPSGPSYVEYILQIHQKIRSGP